MRRVGYYQMMFDADAILPERPHRILRATFDRMVLAGVFDDARLELLHGVIIEMSPQSPEHMRVIAKLTRLFAALVASDRALLHVQGPLGLSEDSEPEPDLALVPPGDYDHAHPSHAWLIVEVAVASAAKDTGLKANLYASANQPEYWVVDVQRRVLIVHRQPLGGVYTDVRSLGEGESISPLQFPELVVSVSAVLPLK